MAGIFVSYRRNDSQGEAGRLFDDLVTHFGEHTVFMDVAAIEAGRDFRRAIEEGITKSGVLLVVMGPEWASAKNKKGARRLDDPEDFVRIEIASALKRDIPVIPVLVRNAPMASVEQLPEDLKELAYRNAIELTHARWRSDIQLLIDALRRLVGDASQSGTMAAGTTAAAMSVTPQSQASRSPKREESSSARLDPADLQLVTRELALRIGPIAGIVVQREASHCNSLEDLYLKVAEEIDSPEERQKFLLEQPSSFSIPIPDVAKRTAPLNNHTEETESHLLAGGNRVVEAALPAPAIGPSNRQKYVLLAIGGVAVVMLALVFTARFAPSKRTGSSNAARGSPPQAHFAESAPVDASASLPTTESPAKNHKAIQLPAAPASVEREAKPSKRVRIPPGAMLDLIVSKSPAPSYPPLARQAHVQGTVILDADISIDGKVETLKAISGHPLLIPAAIEAVEKWQFKPYVLNGEPVAVKAQIPVNFTLTSK